MAVQHISHNLNESSITILLEYELCCSTQTVNVNVEDLPLAALQQLLEVITDGLCVCRYRGAVCVCRYRRAVCVCHYTSSVISTLFPIRAGSQIII